MQILKSPPARRLTLDDLQAIARLIGTRKCTEREACLMLGIRPNQWYTWKHRGKNTDKFENIITRMKSAYVDGLVQNIEDVGHGIGVKHKDWRAHAWLVERLEPEKFGQQAQGAVAPVVNVQVTLLSETFKRLLPDPEQTHKVEDSGSVIQIEDSKKPL